MYAERVNLPLLKRTFINDITNKYGRLVLDTNNKLNKIVEFKDANEKGVYVGSPAKIHK